MPPHDEIARLPRLARAVVLAATAACLWACAPNASSATPTPCQSIDGALESLSWSPDGAVFSVGATRPPVSAYVAIFAKGQESSEEVDDEHLNAVLQSLGSDGLYWANNFDSSVSRRNRDGDTAIVARFNVASFSALVRTRGGFLIAYPDGAESVVAKAADGESDPVPLVRVRGLVSSLTADDSGAVVVGYHDDVEDDAQFGTSVVILGLESQPVEIKAVPMRRWGDVSLVPSHDKLVVVNANEFAVDLVDLSGATLGRLAEDADLAAVSPIGELLVGRRIQNPDADAVCLAGSIP